MLLNAFSPVITIYKPMFIKPHLFQLMWLYILQVHVLKEDFKDVVFLGLALYLVLLVAVTVTKYVITYMTAALTFWKLGVLVSFGEITLTIAFCIQNSCVPLEKFIYILMVTHTHTPINLFLLIVLSSFITFQFWYNTL